MNKKEMFDAFDMTEIDKHKEKYAQEKKQKYGNTDAYKESQKKTNQYAKKDWSSIMKRWDEIYNKIASLMDKETSNPKVQEIVGELRDHITKYFYNCTPDIFRGLGDLYVYDKRFTDNIDKYKVGLSKYIREAIYIYCDNLEK